ncbi:MAG: FecR domain-containing protein [Sphingomonadaceae bacterium]|nr:FecR domain-containing protein [Sphingomonadaceae bacterium]
MAMEDRPIDEQAIAWTIRSREADFDDWEALTEWLEADAAHAKAFERMTMLDDMLPELIPAEPSPLRIVADMAPARRWSFRRLGSIAAAMVALTGLSFLSLQYLPYSVETGAGERQIVALRDGSTIELNGDTKITLRKSDPRHAELERGEALFTVVHNAHDPFIVEVGNAVVKDAGTVFNIVRHGKSTEVGVSEGLVIYNPEKERVALKPGQALRADDRQMGIETFAVPTSAVGGWRRNQLTYDAASMDRVAADLSRSLGRNIAASAEVRDMRFTGTINVQKDADRFVTETAPVLGVGVRRTENGWILVGGDEASR